ncbi:MAG: DUF1800 family protein [Pseudomonadota bacterium]
MTKRAVAVMLALAALGLSGCGGSGGSSSSAPPPPDGGGPPPPPPPVGDGFFDTNADTSRFLTMATFGPVTEDVDALTGTAASDWILAEFDKAPTFWLPIVEDYEQRGGPYVPGTFNPFFQRANTYAFWQTAIEADDQLRQRMAFALSQVLVVSQFGGGVLEQFPGGIAFYQDILARNAFGNYRDLLEEVTYAPAMGYYLTYVGNQRADAATGRNPDENYAREILQLFSLGVIQLNSDGTPQLNQNGDPIELYTNDDITGLARVFTGLIYAEFNVGQPFTRDDIDASLDQPMKVIEESHSPEEKVFLGTTIPENTPADLSIDLALDAIMSHPNIGPFVGRQLIQRFTTSDPDPDYVERVAAAFDAGAYTLPNGISVGEGRRGDLKATIAAVLFDADARPEQAAGDPRFGKVREPLLRITHWARAFEVDASTPEYVLILLDTAPTDSLNQHPYRSPSVFNFYRPGYIAPGTESGALGQTAPELQIVNASSIPGYINVLSYFTLGRQEQEFVRMRPVFDGLMIQFDADVARRAFLPDYTDELALVGDFEALVDHLDTKLFYGSMSDQTRGDILAALQAIPGFDPENEDLAELAVQTAVTMAMSAPDYVVQK